MGSPVNTIVAKIYMEEFENKRVLNTTDHPPRIWKSYVNDTLVIWYSQFKDILQQTNSIDKAIQFTAGDTRPDWAMPFLDIIITLHQRITHHRGIQEFSAHRPITTMGSHCNTAAKYSAVNTLSHRAKTVCSTLELLGQVIELSPCDLSLQSLLWICEFANQ